MKRIEIYENGINIVFEITDENEAKLLHFSALPFDEAKTASYMGLKTFRPVEIQASGIDRPDERHGNKYIVTAPGWRMKFKDFRDVNNDYGRKLELVTFDEGTGLEAVSHYQFYTGTSVVRCWTTLTNKGSEVQTIEYMSSFALTGVEKEGLKKPEDKMKIWVCHNSWQRELQWQDYTLEQVGLASSAKPTEQRSSKVFACTNVGNWSAKEYIPMGVLENTEAGSVLFWQIEQNGSWHWELSDVGGHFYLQLSGPSEIESHWYKNLVPNESIESVKCAVGSVTGSFDKAMGELTKYRRKIRRRNKDNQRLAVIFNDYMNCLWGDPTAEKEFPLVDAAAEAGCEYFCIDAGWYWFFTRHGKRVYDRSRYQLDFRNPKVRAHADEVIDRLVSEYGIGYIKMDYNIEPGIGTEQNCDSVGEGLWGHEKAYLEWLDGVFARHPDLIIENCSSGGLRMDYAMLSRYSIQSTSDQEVVFNMINAMLLRIHQSGHLGNIDPERKALVKEAISVYKKIRADIKEAVPFWSLGLSKFSDDWVSLGLRNGNKAYLAVWRREGKSDTCVLPIGFLKGVDARVKCIYPDFSETPVEFSKATGNVSVKFDKPYMARLFEIEW